MKFRSKGFIMATVVGIGLMTFSGTSFAARVLKVGMSGQDVRELQQKLTEANCYNYSITGYFGEKTKKAVEDFQKSKGIGVDGIVGNVTKKHLGINEVDTYCKKTWFGGANKVFAIGKIANVYDIETGKSFKVKRTFGVNHADCETLTKEDTRIMKEIFGGKWNWNRRAVILTVDGIKIPASIAGMPHAGLDSAPARAYVANRSGGYGRGKNLDTIKGNGMDGHFCIHLLGSKTHASSRVEPKHQAMVKKAIRVLEQS